ncbi:MAG TPA: Gfo/Idh/MocA family oxidoreductase [Caldilineaceae bacterium]|nr:Gfo/Idh/MocA family oxidoreductase [Caldilineaceae bacterium]
MSTPLRAGLAGCGSLSQRGILPHLSLPDAQARVRLVAVADAVPARAAETAERYGIGASFTSVEEMLAGVELDLVLVVTPIQHHFAHALAAIEAGKHVYIQKAMTTTLAEADALLAARDRMGVKLAAAPGYELFPTTGRMRELVQKGVLGRVCVGFTYTMGFGHEFEPIRGGQGALAEIDPAWYYRPGAGPLPDVTVYALQLATSVLGPVRRVTALSNTVAPHRTWRGQTIPVQVDDNNLLLMEFASGALVTAVGANCRGSRRIPWGGMGLYGTGGALEITEVNHASGYPLSFEVTGDSLESYTSELADQPYLQGDHLALEEPHVYADIMDLVDAIVEGRAPRASGEQARHVVEIIERARLAAQTGQTQSLTSSFTGP